MRGLKCSCALPVDAWPLEDRELWESACTPTSFLEARQPLACWGAGHVRGARRHYGAWLRALAEAEPEVLTLHPLVRVTPDRMKRFLNGLVGRMTIPSVANCATDLYGVLASMDPDGDWGWLKSLARKLRKRARRCPRRSPEFVHGAALLDVGRRLIVQAHDQTGALHDPVAFRDGLIVAMLILIPARIAQFSMARIGRELRLDMCRIGWEAADTKTRRDDSYPLPAALMEALRIYLDRVRPWLLSRHDPQIVTDALWIGERGVPIGDQTLRKIIQERTAQILGFRVNPHAFRHSAASTYAIEVPERSREAHAILGHTGFDTTERYYLIGQRAAAEQRAHAALRAVRGAAVR